jgi:hypothetical protein
VRIFNPRLLVKVCVDANSIRRESQLWANLQPAEAGESLCRREFHSPGLLYISEI